MTAYHNAELAAETDPDKPEDTFVIEDALKEMEAAVQDANAFTVQMERNENTRLSWWEGKNGTGRKVSLPGKPANPWNGAADHDSHLTQETINKRNAMRVAALSRGNLAVTAVESSDDARASNMRTVLRYQLNGPMKTQVLMHGLRAGSWADRWGHSVLYVGWKEERGLEPVEWNLQTVIGMLAQDAAARSQGMGLQLMDSSEFEAQIKDPAQELPLAVQLAAMVPGLALRGQAGVRQARKALRAIRTGRDATVYAGYVKYSAPQWEALVPFVDVFYPAEAVFEDNLASCRWVARVKWMSAVQIKEQAAIEGWNAAWVKELLENHKGRSRRLTAKRPWVLSGAGVRYSALNTFSASRNTEGEAQKHLYQIVELWDRSATPDGYVGTYHTVLHPDIPDKVARRQLRADWHGCLPFVAFTCEKDEKLLLASRGVPEITMSAQVGVKAQQDSRTDAAALTTVPIWTGPQELEGMRPSPGKFMPQTRGGDTVQPWTMPAPDGRSIEIERSLRHAVDRFYGLPSEAVPDAVAMAMGQAEMDWFLAGISQAIRLTAQLIQQYLPPLVNARIAGTDEVFSATAEEVRGQFDFAIRFDVRGLDIEWASQMLSFVQKMIVPLDRKGDLNTYPLMEFGLNVLDSSLAQRSLPGQALTQQKQIDDEKAILAQIFSGAPTPDIAPGSDYGGRANVMFTDLQLSPERQTKLMTSVQCFQVYLSRLDGLVNNQKQHQGQNAETGLTLSTDPMAPESKPEQLVNYLKSLKVTWQTDPQELYAHLPELQQFLASLA